VRRSERPTLAQLRALADASKAPWGPLFGFLLETGCRYGEAAALTWAQVDPGSAVGDPWVIRVEPHTLPDGSLWRPKRPASVRALEVAPAAICDLSRRNPGFSTVSGLVFFPSRQRPPARSAVSDYLRRTAAKLGLPPGCGTHDFRRARIAQALAAGADPNTVAACVGHRSLRSTVVYLRDVPVRCALPPLGADEVANPAAQKYLGLSRPANW
jgi:integrase